MTCAKRQKNFSAPSKLGYTAMGVHTTDGFVSMVFTCFIAAIIRNEIVQACRQENVDTNKFICKLCNIKYTRSGSVYSYDGSFPTPVAAVFKRFGLNKDYLKSFDAYINQWYNGSEQNLYKVRNLA